MTKCSASCGDDISLRSEMAVNVPRASLEIAVDLAWCCYFDRRVSVQIVDCSFILSCMLVCAVYLISRCFSAFAGNKHKHVGAQFLSANTRRYSHEVKTALPEVVSQVAANANAVSYTHLTLPTKRIV